MNSQVIRDYKAKLHSAEHHRKSQSKTWTHSRPKSSLRKKSCPTPYQVSQSLKRKLISQTHPFFLPLSSKEVMAQGTSVFCKIEPIPQFVQISASFQDHRQVTFANLQDSTGMPHGPKDPRQTPFGVLVADLSLKQTDSMQFILCSCEDTTFDYIKIGGAYQPLCVDKGTDVNARENLYPDSETNVV